MTHGRFPIALIVLANLVPLLIGIVAYEFLYGSFGSAYVWYTLSFWCLAAAALYLFNRRSLGPLFGTLRIDLERRSLCRFLVFVAFVLVALNLDWLAQARAIGPESAGIRFRFFFLFEDLLFIVFAVLLWWVTTRVSITRLALAAAFGLPMLVVFGRFAAIGTFLLTLLLLKARPGRPGLHRVAGLLVVSATIAASTAVVEWSRLGEGDVPQVALAFTDRVGEMATLLVADQIMEFEEFDGFQGVGRLQYLYVPSIVFPEKPAVNDGAEYMREEFGLGAGENGIRFPIMLHLDSYRRFGWSGLWIATLPALMLRLLTFGAHAAWRRFGVPFLPIVIAKYFIFIYPRSVLGLIQICFYTIPRSALVLFVLLAGYEVLATVGGRRSRTASLPTG